MSITKKNAETAEERREKIQRRGTGGIQVFLCYFCVILSDLCGFCIFASDCNAQPITFESAVQEMLAKNFDIRIVSSNNEAASQLNNAGNAGFLPTLDASFGYEKSFNNTDQKYYDGRERSANNAQSNSLRASVLLNWVLFDGFRMFAEKDVLESNETMSEYELRAVSEEGILMLATLYYQIVQQKKSLEVSRQSLEVSRERYRLAQKRKDIGSASMQEVIQAMLDFNEDSIHVLRQEALIANLITDVNLMLARNVMDSIDVTGGISADTTLSLDALLDVSAKNNVELLIARENIRLAQAELNKSRSFMYPEAGVYAGFDYSKSTSEVGVLQSNRSYGPNIGVFVNFNLFNGLKDYKNIKAERIQQKSSHISQEKALANNTAAILKSFRNYESAYRIWKLERTSVEKANQNVSIALKKYELGSISAVEFRDIQLQHTEAQSRLLLAEYDLRINELELKRLAGLLQF